MRARALLMSTLTTAAIATTATVGAGTAAAAPHHRAEAELRQEIADDSYRPPAWMLDPRNQRGAVTTRPYGPADVILGVTLVVGLVVLW